MSIRKFVDSRQTDNREWRWGLTHAEFATLIGIRTHVAISRIELLEIYPFLAEAIACSIIFDTPPIELFPELYAKVYEFVLSQAKELYEELQGNPSRVTSKAQLSRRGA